MNSPLLVIVGETASGKSSLALRLAQLFGGEIICADSWTVRREVNIGTAKPSLKDRALVPHHLLDVTGPCDDFTAAVFKDLANKAILDITKREKLPILVGGTGLYIDSVLYDYGFLPAGDRQQREELNTLSTEVLLQLCCNTGQSLEGIDIYNKRRLIRFLETKGVAPTKGELRENSFIIGLRTDHEILKQRVEKRTNAMLAAGLETEVRDLARRYGWSCEALKGVGYAQWREYFLGSQSVPVTRQKIIKATLDLAKRQRTWFKRNSSIQWFTTPVKETVIVDSITTFLNTKDL